MLQRYYKKRKEGRKQERKQVYLAETDFKIVLL